MNELLTINVKITLKPDGDEEVLQKYVPLPPPWL